MNEFESSFIVVRSSEEPDAKKAKEDEAEEYNLADIAEGSVSSVSIRESGRHNHHEDGCSK